MGLVDYHVHTTLCNHARGDMETCCARAAELGLSGICFLDHLTLRPEQRPLSMEPAEVPLYYYAARRLARRWEDRLEVRVGLEVDFDPARKDTAREIVESFSFDVVACSLHYLDDWNLVSRGTQAGNPYENAETMAEAYFDVLGAMLSDPFFDVVGHLDGVKKFVEGGGNLPLERWDAAVAAIARAGLCVEVNTSGWDHPADEQYPSVGLLEKLYRAGVDVTLGSDAHRPEDMGRYLDRAASLLSRVGYTRIRVYEKRNPETLPLAAPGEARDGVTGAI
ncbi:MAG: histidinol-phosphatase [Desulfatibacillaceae bacterium]